MAEYENVNILAVSNTFTLPKQLMVSDLSMGAKMVFTAISYVGDTGRPAKIEDVSEMIGKSRTTALRYLKELRESGWIDFVKKDASGRIVYAVSKDLSIYKKPDAPKDTAVSSAERVIEGGSSIQQFIIDLLKSMGVEPDHGTAQRICMRLANSSLDKDRWRKYLTDDVSRLVERIERGDLRPRQAKSYIATDRNIRWWQEDDVEAGDEVNSINWDEMEES